MNWIIEEIMGNGLPLVLAISSSITTIKAPNEYTFEMNGCRLYANEHQGFAIFSEITDISLA